MVGRNGVGKTEFCKLLTKLIKKSTPKPKSRNLVLVLEQGIYGKVYDYNVVNPQQLIANKL